MNYPDNEKYELITVQLREEVSYKDDTKRWTYSYSRDTGMFSTKKKLLQVIEILGIQGWAIRDRDTSRYVMKSAIVQEIDDREEKEKTEQKLEIEEARKRINKLPTHFGFKDLDLYIERDEMPEKPNWGFKEKHLLSIYQVGNKKDDFHSRLLLDDYITSDGKILAKQFAENMHRWFSDKECKTLNPKDTLTKIKARFDEVMEMIYEAQRGDKK